MHVGEAAGNDFPTSTRRVSCVRRPPLQLEQFTQSLIDSAYCAGKRFPSMRPHLWVKYVRPSTPNSGSSFHPPLSFGSSPKD